MLLLLPTSNSGEIWIGNFATFTDKGLCVSIESTPPLKKITYAKKFLRNYFRGDCDGFA